MVVENKKKIIGGFIAIIVLGIAIVGGYVGMGYYYANKNDNYTEAQIKEIALKQIDGEVISVQKEFNLEDDRISRSEYEYDVEIKTSENLLKTITVKGRTGTIEIDDDFDDDHISRSEFDDKN
ncbi:hypothetical protein F7984_05225 [Pradoshia sp. D12]|nr:hypothetical protein A8L44_02985 [Bacillus sp. FJAT-27986]QFK73214.1 hypothetical protein F7984_05225 [Pradoshia sp. D12]TPF73753.1 hypothetical protein FHY44_01620 [Bacillus sp. D12]